MSLPFVQVPEGFALLNGKYDDLYSAWYLNIGTQITLIMILGAILPQVLMFKSWIISTIRRWNDKGAVWSAKAQTNTYTQEQWQTLHTGSDFRLDDRLSQIVMLVWVTYLYSSGIPALYAILTLSLFIIYWVDKLQIIYFYKKPKDFGKESILYTINLLKFAIFWHFLIGAIVYSNENILSQQEKSTGFARFYKSNHSLVFIIFMILI